ncbi:MAG: epoxyqueuosine reductase QueH [Thermoplasmata archaeon]|nr:MAG: epoxyqueuosine reductase QueH [Thermoplasmata archaeon]
MKILIHVCCAPCFTYPHKRLRKENHEVVGFFYNPNIHPYTEYKARLHALQRYTSLKPVEIIYNNEYPLKEFVSGQLKAMDEGKKRCEFCIKTRLKKTAQTAKDKGFDAFTTTLLESKYQPHDLIREIGEDCAKEFDCGFYYEDFRVGWKESVSLSKELELYRQKYCGCIFSEKERYLDK